MISFMTMITFLLVWISVLICIYHYYCERYDGSRECANRYATMLSIMYFILITAVVIYLVVNGRS